jgi:hypothetical protein
MDVRELPTRADVPTTEGQRRGLLAGVFVGPLAWFVQLEANYALVPWVCSGGHRIVLLVVAAVAIAASTLAGLAAWRSWPGGERLTGEPKGIEGARLLSLLGVLLSASFVVVLIASAIPPLVLRPCD